MNDEKYILNEDEFGDWNYYGYDGNLKDDEEKVNQNVLIGVAQKKLKQTPTKILDYENFKKNLVVESIDDREKQEKFEKDRLKREEVERANRLVQQAEEEKRRKVLEELEKKKRRQEEIERECKMNKMKGVEKIKEELEIKKTMMERYGQNIDPERKAKFSIYESVSVDRKSSKQISLKVEGIDITKRADPIYLKNELNQPYNLNENGQELSLHTSNFRPVKAVSVDNSNLKREKTPDKKQKVYGVPASFNEFQRDLHEFEENSIIYPKAKKEERTIYNKEALQKQLNKKVELKVYSNPNNNNTQNEKPIEKTVPIPVEKKVEPNKLMANIPFGEEGNIMEKMTIGKGYNEKVSTKNTIYNKITARHDAYMQIADQINSQSRSRDVSPVNMRNSDEVNRDGKIDSDNKNFQSKVKKNDELRSNDKNNENKAAR